MSSKNPYREMLKLEEEFAYCCRRDEPGRWHKLQSELGEVYKRVIKYFEVVNADKMNSNE